MAEMKEITRATDAQNKPPLLKRLSSQDEDVFRISQEDVELMESDLIAQREGSGDGFALPFYFDGIGLSDHVNDQDRRLPAAHLSKVKMENDFVSAAHCHYLCKRQKIPCDEVSKKEVEEWQRLLTSYRTLPGGFPLSTLLNLTRDIGYDRLNENHDREIMANQLEIYREKRDGGAFHLIHINNMKELGMDVEITDVDRDVAADEVKKARKNKSGKDLAQNLFHAYQLGFKPEQTIEASPSLPPIRQFKDTKK